MSSIAEHKVKFNEFDSSPPEEKKINQNVGLISQKEGSWKIHEYLSSLSTEIFSIKEFQEEESLRLDLEKILEELSEIFFECKMDNWGGEDERPISKETYDNAIKFITELPIYISNPSVGPTPLGEINFEWRADNKKIFLVNVSEDRKVAYASLLGGDGRAKGKAGFSTLAMTQIWKFLKDYFS